MMTDDFSLLTFSVLKEECSEKSFMDTLNEMAVIASTEMFNTAINTAVH